MDVNHGRQPQTDERRSVTSVPLNVTDTNFKRVPPVVTCGSQARGFPQAHAGFLCELLPAECTRLAFGAHRMWLPWRVEFTRRLLRLEPVGSALRRTPTYQAEVVE